jgi:hypothetical protein
MNQMIQKIESNMSKKSLKKLNEFKKKLKIPIRT